MILKVFDVAHGSSSFLVSPTGKTELVDLGACGEWSPLDHIYTHYLPKGGRLDRLVLTHHHGDHLQDVDNLTTPRMPEMVQRRHLSEGRYGEACKKSNSDEGQRRALKFDQLFRTYTRDAAAEKTSDSAWGMSVTRRSLSATQADGATSSWNSMANCCSLLSLYEHQGSKFLLCGDMEAEGMSLLLDNNPNFRSQLRGVDVLVAPHHGHKSGFSTDLMRAIGKPDVVIASVMSGDASVDSRYSSSEWVGSISWDDGSTRRLLTTRDSGALTVESKGGGGFHITSHTR